MTTNDHLGSPRFPAQRGASRDDFPAALLTVEEAAAILRVGRSLMYELIAAGAIETVRVGRLRRIRPSALAAFVASLG